jgi:glycosyltransferase involved in cell wall biosynthesis
VDLFLKAAARVIPILPEARFWVVGDGELRGELERLVGDLALGEKAMFWGRRNDVRKLLSEMAVGVICSDSEGLSNAIMEYMEAGLPVVATSVGGNPELVRHGVTGLLVPPDQEKLLAQAMQTLLADPNRAVEMGAAGRKAIENGFSVSGMVEKTRELYACHSRRQ